MQGESLLSAASDEELVERAHDGDERALEVLLERYRIFARAKARSYYLAGADREDIVQEGMIGLYKAVRDFRADKTAGFAIFADLCIKRQIITAIKAAARHKHAPLNAYVSLNEPASGPTDGPPLSEILSGPVFDDPAEIVASAEEIAGLQSAMGRVLSTLESEVLSMYVDGKSYQEIADTLGRHVKSIDNALQRIKRKIEHHLADERSSD